MVASQTPGEEGATSACAPSNTKIFNNFRDDKPVKCPSMPPFGGNHLSANDDVYTLHKIDAKANVRQVSARLPRPPNGSSPV